MPVTVTEKMISRPSVAGEGASVQLLYTIKGTASDTTATAELEATAPVTYNSLRRKSVYVKPVFVDITNPAGSIWDGTARYGVGVGSVFSFDTSGGTQHITQSLNTVQAYGPGAHVNDFGGAIGVSANTVEGVDIHVPVHSWSERHYLASAVVTASYRAKLFWLTGCVNEDAFLGFEPGEVLFLGATGSQRGNEDWEISFRFAASPNMWGLPVGAITGIRKRGWEYLWVRYKSEVQNKGTANEFTVTVPDRAYVEQVYRYAPFSRLGIG